MNNLTKLTLTLLAACTTVPMLLGQAAANRNTTPRTQQQQAQQALQAVQQAEQQQTQQKSPALEYAFAREFRNKVFEIKNRDSAEIRRIITGLGSGVSGTLIESSEMQDIKTITVRDFPENIKLIEEAIGRLDVPVQVINVDLQIRVDIIWASNKELKGNPAPSHLSNVISTISNTLNYKNFIEGATFTMRGNGKSDVMSVGKLGFPNTTSGLLNDAMCNLMRSNYDTDNGVLDSMFVLSYNGTRINSNIKIADGETIVTGTTFIGDIAMIAIVSIERIS